MIPGTARTRRLPVGAEVQPAGATHFRVWAPRAGRVEVAIESPRAAVVRLEREAGGYFAGLAEGVGDGALYRYRLDDREDLLPDPASRFQPAGPHGPSRVVDPARFRWRDAGWRGVAPGRRVFYELHIGTFTPEGTWAAAARWLPELASVGVTVLEVMPVAEFPGRFGWGYDGVALYAPTRLYGEPDDFRGFVDAAHAAGLAVVLDVVYNHFGPDGAYHREFAAEYHTDRHSTEWGDALNFDGPQSEAVREFIVANAGHWIEEYHLDGLRLDAAQALHDASAEHVVAAIVRRVRQAGRGRHTVVIAEDEPQEAWLLRPRDRGGAGLDALWNDDFHHAARVAATGRNEAYYTDYLGTPQELVSAVKWGFLYQGQRYRWQGKRRGTPSLDVAPGAFVCYLQNHDQVANSGRGQRLHRLTSPGRFRALTALLLLAPQTPLLFQGQEFCASAPWLYFADHAPPLASAVSRGRAEFLAQFPSLATPETQARLAPPGDRATFERCRLDATERERHAEAVALHRDLLRLRREDPVFAGERRRGVDGAVLGAEAFVLRFFGDGAADRLLLVNLGRDLVLDPAPEPLLAPAERSRWTVLWSSEDPRYGGSGTPPPETDDGWRLPGQAAVAMAAAPASP